MGLGFSLFTREGCHSPQLQLSAGALPMQTQMHQICLITLHFAQSEPMNRPIATGHHVPGKVPGTSGVEA